MDRPAGGGVGQPVRPLTLGGLGEPDQRRDARCVARETLERLDVGLGEVVLEIKVLGRVTGQGELGEDHEVGPRVAGP